MQNVATKIGDLTKSTEAVPGVFVALLVGSLCLTRPSMFGQDFNFVGGIGILFTTFAFLFTRKGSRIEISMYSPEARTAAALLAFWTYVFGLSIFFGSSNVPFLLFATIAGFTVALCFLLLSSNGTLIDQTFSLFARLNSVLGYSILVTYCLIPLIGYSTIRLFGYTISGYEATGAAADALADGGNGDVLFPFTVVYGKMVDYGIYRFCGIYREAGIAQAFFVWSFIYLCYSRARLIWIIGAILGALLCGATAVIFSLALAAAIHFGSGSLRRPRYLAILVALLGILALLLVFVPGLGLQDKAVTHSASLTDRQSAMELALPGNDTWKWLFGRGMFYESTEAVANAGINGIAAIFGIGAIGFVLYLYTFIAGAFGRRCPPDAFRYLTLISPFLVTSLFFQPFIDAPLVLAVLFFFPESVRDRSLSVA